ncbi:MAG: DUF4230 domain-containing protein [Crocinitomicaceae bacterium]|nr:DUF4230 domain-containing protein [Crocinitomicaceae bacterium]
MDNDIKRLLKNVLALLIVAAAGVAIYIFVFTGNSDDLEIEDTPIHIESIRTIAEISTVSYTDEVVMDTVEFHKGITSNYSIDDWITWYNNDVKRRLTLIIRGEIRYGLDLTDGNFTIESNKDTIWLSLPQAKLLDVIVSPSNTEVFQETVSRGNAPWSDDVRKQMEMKAKAQLTEDAESLNLEAQAQENAERMFTKLIQTDKELIIEFDEN